MDRSQRRLLLGLIAAAALFASTYALHWPAMYSTADEASYVGTALTFARGHLRSDTAGVELAFPVHSRAGHSVGRYPLGWPLLLAGVVRGGPAACFGLALALHLAAAALMARLLWVLGRDVGWAALLLFYPTAVLYSRTLMANGPTMVLVLAGAVLYLAARLDAGGGRAGPLLLAGLCLGLAGLMRPVAFGLVLAFALSAAWRMRARGARAALRAGILLGAGAIPAVLLGAGYNLVAFGALTRTGYHLAAHEHLFAFEYAWPKLVVYTGLLLLVYPGLAAAPFLDRGRLSVEARFALAWYLGVYGFYYYLEQGGGRIETTVKSLRFFLPVAPLLLASYANLWERLLAGPRAERWRRALLAFAVVALAAGTFLLQRRHADFQSELAVSRSAIYNASAEGDVIVSTMDGLKLLQNRWWGEREILDLQDQQPVSQLVSRVDEALDEGRGVYLVLLERKNLGVLWNRAVQARRAALASVFRLDLLLEAERAGVFWRLRVERISPRN